MPYLVIGIRKFYTSVMTIFLDLYVDGQPYFVISVVMYKCYQEFIILEEGEYQKYQTLNIPYTNALLQVHLFDEINASLSMERRLIQLYWYERTVNRC